MRPHASALVRLPGPEGTLTSGHRPHGQSAHNDVIAACAESDHSIFHINEMLGLCNNGLGLYSSLHSIRSSVRCHHPDHTGRLRRRSKSRRSWIRSLRKQSFYSAMRPRSGFASGGWCQWMAAAPFGSGFGTQRRGFRPQQGITPCRFGTDLTPQAAGHRCHEKNPSAGPSTESDDKRLQPFQRDMSMTGGVHFAIILP